MTPQIFRALLTAWWILASTAVILSYAFEPLLPIELQHYLTMKSRAELTVADLVLFSLAAVAIVALFVSTIGLYSWKPWSRRLFLVANFVGYCATPFDRSALVLPSESGWAHSASEVLLGVLIASMYFVDPIRRKFEPREATDSRPLVSG